MARAGEAPPSCSSSAAAGCWKRHIVRQLQQRDRGQKALFLGLVQAYNKLLEKSNLLDCIAQKAQVHFLDLQMGLPPRLAHDSSDFLLGVFLGSAQSLKGHGRCIVKLKSVNGELAYKVVEQNAELRTKDAQLETQRDRLTTLSEQVSALEAKHQQLKEQAEKLASKNAALKEKYDTLQERYCLRDGEFRRAFLKGLEMIEGLMQKAAEAAEHQNDKNERRKQARLAKELKKATKRIICSPETEPDGAHAGERKMTSTDVPDQENGEKLWRKPFRSASAASITLTRYVDAFKGWFDFRLKRGNSVSSVSEDRYCSIPLCTAARLPSQVSDTQEAHFSEIDAIKFSPNSGLLATGGTDQLIRLWSVTGGRLENMQTLEGANGSITSLEFDPSGRHILAASYNNAAHLWKVGDFQCKEILTGHTDKVTAAKFRSTWHQAVTGSRDRTVKEWDLGKAACSRTINVFSYCNDVVCCDAVIVSGHHDKTIRFWDSRGPGCTEVIPVEGKVTSLSLSLDQMHLLCCSRDNALKVIDLRMHNVRQVFRAEGFTCGSDWTKAVFSPDKRYVLVGSANGTLYLWNMETGKLETSLSDVHRCAVNAVAWSPFGESVASVDRCRKVVLWR